MVFIPGVECHHLLFLVSSITTCCFWCQVSTLVMSGVECHHLSFLVLSVTPCCFWCQVSPLVSGVKCHHLLFLVSSVTTCCFWCQVSQAADPCFLCQLRCHQNADTGFWCRVTTVAISLSLVSKAASCFISVSVVRYDQLSVLVSAVSYTHLTLPTSCCV